MAGRCCTPALAGSGGWHLQELSLSIRPLVLRHQKTRASDRLLGPCYKTGDASPASLASSPGLAPRGRDRRKRREPLLCTSSRPTRRPTRSRGRHWCLPATLKNFLALPPGSHRGLVTAPRPTRSLGAYLSPRATPGTKRKSQASLATTLQVRPGCRFGKPFRNPSWPGRLPPQTPRPRATLASFRNPNFRHFSPSFQSSFHLSFAVLFRYRSLDLYLALGLNYVPLCCPLPRTTTLEVAQGWACRREHGTLTLHGPAFQQSYHARPPRIRAPPQTLQRGLRLLKVWALPASLAGTGGIVVTLFSWGY